MLVIYIVLGISVLLIVLGFIALLKQKLYIDRKTKEVMTEIELPLIGKLRTNAPALGFIIFAVVLAYTASQQGMKLEEKRLEEKRLEKEGAEQWTVSGKVEFPKASGELALINEACKTNQYMCFHLDKGYLDIDPVNVQHPDVADTGRFDLAIRVPNGRSFEQEIRRITYSHAGLTDWVVLFDKNHPKDYLKDSGTPTIRTLKPVVIPAELFSKKRMEDRAAR